MELHGRAMRIVGGGVIFGVCDRYPLEVLEAAVLGLILYLRWALDFPRGLKPHFPILQNRSFQTFLI